jgi:TetR/AcrR family transcriptional regulator, regulator of cefoperazone and chloramphenicol sensitivity
LIYGLMPSMPRKPATSATAPVAPSPLPADTRAPRADGVQARARILTAALKLFAQHGFAKTSTREIAMAAQANIGAISYYFGDKAGLYRAVFTEPLGSPHEDMAQFDDANLTLRESIHGFYASFLAPLKQGHLVQQCMRLHFREMLEPTGMWAQELEQGIKPAQQALLNTLCRHLGVKKVDDDMQQLCFAVVALALQMFMGRDVIDAIAPQLVDSPQAIDRTTERMTLLALSMIEGERQRRLEHPRRSNLKAPLEASALAKAQSRPTSQASQKPKQSETRQQRARRPAE